MKDYEIDLEGFCEDIFHEMEYIQDGNLGHIVTFEGETKLGVAYDIADRLISFLEKQLKEKK
jgi:hypothetical protein